MLGANVWRSVLGVDRATVIEEIELERGVEHGGGPRATEALDQAALRAFSGARSPGYDQGEGRRNWRALDLGTVMCFLQADSPGSSALSTERPSPRCPGPATVRDTPEASTTRWPGWSPTPLSRPSAS